MNCLIYFKEKDKPNIKEKNWTENQTLAIEKDAKEIYVSAAAGSGKTSVLTQRIIDKISSSLDLDDFLITTFTKAAANDLKKKIEDYIGKELMNDRDNLHLKEQLSKISTADICTMDSFFYDTVIDNTNALGLPSNFGIIEKIDEQEIYDRTLEKMLEDYARGKLLFPNSTKEESIEKIKHLINIYGELDNPKAIIREIESIYKKYSSYTDIKKNILCGLSEKTVFKDSPWYNYLLNSIDDILKTLENAKDYVLPSKQEYIETKGCSINGYNSLILCLDNAINLYNNIKISLEENDFSYARPLFKIGCNSRYFLPNHKILISSIKPLFSVSIDGICKLFKTVFDNEPSELDKYIHETYTTLNDLSDFILKFHELSLEEKKKRKLFSFSDITRYTYELLVDENGKPNSLCENFGNKYKEIYIDEFQDTNQIQFTIFSLLSKNSNLFVVGDVKQSIYAFREAKPEILNDKITNDTIIQVTQDNKEKIYEKAKIFLNQNFRSNDNVINTINKIFDSIASCCDVFPYEKEDKLRKGKQDIFKHYNFDDYNKFKKAYTSFFNANREDIDKIIVFSDKEVKDDINFDNDITKYVVSSSLIYLISRCQKKRKYEYGINGIFVDNVFSFGDNDFSKDCMEIFEPKSELIFNEPKTKNDGNEENKFNDSYPIISKILELHYKYNYDYSDIAVLYHNNKQKNRFAELLHEFKIPCNSENYLQFFENPEIVYIVNLLEAINNSYKDTYLAGSIIGPIYSFTLSDLIYIKEKYKDYSGFSLYEIFNLYVNDEDDKDEIRKQKVRKYLDDLIYYKKYLSNNSCYLLIDKIYLKTNLISVFILNDENNVQIKNNLYLFRDLVYKFEKGRQKTLFDLLIYIDFFKNNPKEINFEDGDLGMSDGVIVTTIHSSKGLEYPVVIIPELERGLKGDEANNYILSNNFPMTINFAIPDENKHKPNLRYRSCLSDIAKSYNCDFFIDEHIRLFYVALTRAKEKLILFSNLTQDNMQELSVSTKISFDDFMYYTKANKANISSYRELIINSNYYYNSLFETSIISSQDFNYKTLEHHNNADVYVNIDEIFFGQDIKKDKNTKKDSYSDIDLCEYKDEIEELKNEFKDRFSWTYYNADDIFIKSKLYVSMVYPGILDYDEELPEEIITRDVYFIKEQPLFIRQIPSYRRASDVGTIMHTFMSYLNLKNVDDYGIDYELDRMVKDEFMEKSDVEVLMKDKLINFCKSKLAYDLRRSKECYKETRFVKNFPAEHFTNNLIRKEKLKGKDIIVQGQLDLLFKNEKDEWILVDYKTDYSGRQYNVDRNLAIKVLLDRHSLQLSLYKVACEELFNIKISHTMLYSFAIDDTIELSEDRLDYIKNLERKYNEKK